MLVNKQENKAVVIDLANPSDSNIKKKYHKKVEKYQGLKEERGKLWRMKALVVFLYPIDNFN